MSEPVKRAYRAPRREAAAALTRATILGAAQARFEHEGWAATTVKAVAKDAGVSPKTIEAIFGTKAALLQATVSFALRGGDEDTRPMIERAPAQAFVRAETAREALTRHAAYARPITERSALMAAVVESAARSDERLRELWATMTHNRRFGARWAATHLLAKPGLEPQATPELIETTVLLAIDWATYRTLTQEAGFSPEAYEAWMREYYARMLLA